MDYTRLGTTGMSVSRICLGMMSYGSKAWRDWILDYDEGYPIVKRAVELGITFFDTADVYSIGASEEVTGRYLKEFFNSRDEYVLATKVFNPMGEGLNQRGLSRKHIMDGVDASLKRLDTDYIDLYQIHRWDYETPIEETMEALHDVVKAGKARYIGASSMWAWQFSKAQYTADLHGWTRFVTMQNHYSLIYREEEREMNPLCLDMGVGLIPWSPLARGFLAGNVTREDGAQTKRAKSDTYIPERTETDFDTVDRLKEIAEKHDASPAQVALAWMLQRPGVSSPIIGATKMHHLEEAIGAVDVKLSDEDVAYLEELYQPREIYGHN
ncbi:aldo/keto reductase [Phototrophicus methaneseepsis]|uniref:Aldo/keto reductase n=1 Tax=Phototrophicus methaneseepsis TaxID=2710758 RepID=A0A7S8E560_9CHLR|nr:aldo/keto reductase [Phototrophicus methaneseepsis]QPC80545.1 aldo/keto reductase [Phototrophicus methaneseepsis]